MTEPLRCDLSAVDLFSSAQTTEDTGEYSRGGTGRPFSTPLTVHLSAASTQIHTEVSRARPLPAGQGKREASWQMSCISCLQRVKTDGCCHKVCVWKGREIVSLFRVILGTKCPQKWTKPVFGMSSKITMIHKVNHVFIYFFCLGMLAHWH